MDEFPCARAVSCGRHPQAVETPRSPGRRPPVTPFPDPDHHLPTPPFHVKRGQLPARGRDRPRRSPAVPSCRSARRSSTDSLIATDSETGAGRSIVARTAPTIGAEATGAGGEATEVRAEAGVAARAVDVGSGAAGRSGRRGRRGGWCRRRGSWCRRRGSRSGRRGTRGGRHRIGSRRRRTRAGRRGSRRQPEWRPAREPGRPTSERRRPRSRPRLPGWGRWGLAVPGRGGWRRVDLE